MPLLIDVYNVLHVTGVLPPDLAGIGVEELCDLITVSRYRHMPAMLILDGPSPGVEGDVRPVSPDLTLRWAGSGKDADTLIERLIRKDSAPRRLIVVSSDRRLQRAGERRGSRAMRSEDFLARLVDDRRRLDRTKTQPLQSYEIPLDPGSISWWLGYFGVEESDEMARLKAQGPRTPPKPTPPRKTEPPSPTDGTTPNDPMTPPSEDDEGMIDVDSINIDDWL